MVAVKDGGCSLLVCNSLGFLPVAAKRIDLLGSQESNDLQLVFNSFILTYFFVVFLSVLKHLCFLLFMSR